MKLKSFWGEQPDHWPFGQWSGTFFCGCADSADPPDQFNNLFSTRQPTYAPRTLPTPLARNAVVVPTISPSDRPTAPPTLTPKKRKRPLRRHSRFGSWMSEHGHL